MICHCCSNVTKLSCNTLACSVAVRCAIAYQLHADTICETLACRIIWAAQYNTWLLIELRPKGVVFSFLFHADSNMANAQWRVEYKCALGADEKGLNCKKCHLRPLQVQLPAQLLYLLPGSSLNFLQLLQLPLQGFYMLPLPGSPHGLMPGTSLNLLQLLLQGFYTHEGQAGDCPCKG